jgi:hypothetical protein
MAAGLLKPRIRSRPALRSDCLSLHLGRRSRDQHLGPEGHCRSQDDGRRLEKSFLVLTEGQRSTRTQAPTASQNWGVGSPDLFNLARTDPNDLTASGVIPTYSRVKSSTHDAGGSTLSGSPPIVASSVANYNCGHERRH